MGSPMEQEAGGDVERSSGLSWPARAVVGGLAVIGAVTMVQRILAIFSWLLTLLMIIVVLAALAYMVVTGRYRR